MKKIYIIIFINLSLFGVKYLLSSYLSTQGSILSSIRQERVDVLNQLEDVNQRISKYKSVTYISQTITPLNLTVLPIKFIPPSSVASINK